MKTRTIIVVSSSVLLVLMALVWLLLPGYLDNKTNTVIAHPDYLVSPSARSLHQSLIIGDLHSDSTLWKRDLLQRYERGHMDIPRLREGNVALQMFTTVTKVPAGINYEKNSAQATDRVTQLALIQGWPVATWNSYTARALYQASKLQLLAEQAPEQLQLIRTNEDLQTLLKRRANGETVIGGLLGTEGSHALDGKLENIQLLSEAGFVMMSLQHFFDNELGGSLHGETGSGLTDFGRQALEKMLALQIMVDVSHSSVQVVEEVLTLSDKPLIVSHTGLFGHCQSKRNISDELMIKIARAGGLIGIGYWDAAVCDATPENIVKAFRYGIELLGEDHLALGSDFDGAIAAPFDTSELAVLTGEMLKAGFTDTEIRKVMGGNMVRFLSENLPIDKETLSYD